MRAREIVKRRGCFGRATFTAAPTAPASGVRATTPTLANLSARPQDQHHGASLGERVRRLRPCRSRLLDPCSEAGLAEPTVERPATDADGTRRDRDRDTCGEQHDETSARSGISFVGRAIAAVLSSPVNRADSFSRKANSCLALKAGLLVIPLPRRLIIGAGLMAAVPRRGPARSALEDRGGDVLRRDCARPENREDSQEHQRSQDHQDDVASRLAH
jgi:hypothetical protein